MALCPDLACMSAGARSVVDCAECSQQVCVTQPGANCGNMLHCLIQVVLGIFNTLPTADRMCLESIFIESENGLKIIELQHPCHEHACQQCPVLVLVLSQTHYHTCTPSFSARPCPLLVHREIWSPSSYKTLLNRTTRDALPYCHKDPLPRIQPCPPVLPPVSPSSTQHCPYQPISEHPDLPSDISFCLITSIIAP